MTRRKSFWSRASTSCGSSSGTGRSTKSLAREGWSSGLVLRTYDTTAMRIGRSRPFWWLFGTYSLLVFATTGILGLVVNQWVEQYGSEQVEQSLRMHAFLIAQDLQDLGTDAPIELQRRVDAMQR